MQVRYIVSGIVLLPLASLPGFSQTYPTKPIRIVSTSPTGNAGDTAMRLVTPAISAALGQPIVIENRPQGLGIPAMTSVRDAAPDGHTLLQASIANITWAPYLTRDFRIDTMKDFGPVAKLIDVPNLVTVHASVPANNLREFIDYAKRNAGKLTYGSTGIGSGFEFFPEALGLAMVNVPYAGQSVGQTINDLATNRIQALFYSYTSIAPVLPSGNVKVLAQISRTRTKVLSHVPTVYETLPDFSMGPAWFGVFAPAGLPLPIARRLQSEFAKGLLDSQVTAKLEGLGTTPGKSTVEEFSKEVRRDYEVAGKLARALKIEPK